MKKFQALLAALDAHQNECFKRGSTLSALSHTRTSLLVEIGKLVLDPEFQKLVEVPS